MDPEIPLFTANSGLQVKIFNKMDVIDFVTLFPRDESYQLISEHSNLYAAQYTAKNRNCFCHYLSNLRSGKDIEKLLAPDYLTELTQKPTVYLH